LVLRCRFSVFRHFSTYPPANPYLGLSLSANVATEKATKHILKRKRLAQALVLAVVALLVDRLFVGIGRNFVVFWIYLSASTPAFCFYNGIFVFLPQIYPTENIKQTAQHPRGCFQTNFPRRQC
jgi:hypothetical protein